MGRWKILESKIIQRIFPSKYFWHLLVWLSRFSLVQLLQLQLSHEWTAAITTFNLILSSFLEVFGISWISLTQLWFQGEIPWTGIRRLNTFLQKKSLRTVFLTELEGIQKYWNFRCTSPGFPPSVDVGLLEVSDWAAVSLPIKRPTRAAETWPRLQQRVDPDGNKPAEAQSQQGDLHKSFPKEKWSETQSGSE